MTITNMQGVALWTLANNLGHEWAGSRQDRDAIEADGWDAATARVTAGMEASHDEMSESQHSMPAGLWPAVAHTTGSGRLSWYCRSYGEGRSLRSVVQIDVCRPAPGLRGGSSVVLRLTAQLTEDGAWILADFESVPELIELRHIQALSYALYASEDECYVRHIVDHIGDAALAERLEPEIVVAQERLVAYEAEYQARCDAYMKGDPCEKQ
jgi:hypothetical protein